MKSKQICDAVRKFSDCERKLREGEKLQLRENSDEKQSVDFKTI